MKSLLQNLIEIAGITQEPPRSARFFRQFSLQADLVLPESKPDIGQLLKVTVRMEVLRTKRTGSPEGRSPEGVLLTGFKLTAEGCVHYRLEYESPDPAHSVYTAHFALPFCTHVALEREAACSENIQTICLVEDVHLLQRDKRALQTSVLLAVIAVPPVHSSLKGGALHDCQSGVDTGL